MLTKWGVTGGFVSWMDHEERLRGMRHLVRASGLEEVVQLVACVYVCVFTEADKVAIGLLPLELNRLCPHA